MSMFSDIATSSALEPILKKVASLLKKSSSTSEAESLKAVGRCAMEQFEWDTPQWAEKYRALFKAGPK